MLVDEPRPPQLLSSSPYQSIVHSTVFYKPVFYPADFHPSASARRELPPECSGVYHRAPPPPHGQEPAASARGAGQPPPQQSDGITRTGGWGSKFSAVKETNQRKDTFSNGK